MSDSAAKYVLGSRSPRRLELLRLLVPKQAIKVLPPRSAGELGFEGLHDWPAIEARILQIVRHKNEDVLSQLPAENEATIITADTVIVAIDEAQRSIVLGQPPPGENWRDLVRDWFLRYYLGKTHLAATAFCIEKPKGERIEQVVTTRVTFHADDPETRSLVEWYLDTGESLGKAGGYAIQGAGSLFIAAVEGSLSNVVGLPLRELSLAISCP